MQIPIILSLQGLDGIRGSEGEQGPRGEDGIPVSKLVKTD